MRPSTELFDLIKSLTKTEKRYFKLYSAIQNGNKNYLKLFDQIERMENYDETELRDSFKRLTFTKHYLYNAIIKSLKAYNTDNTMNVKLPEQVVRLKILYHKSLFKQFYKGLAALKLQAREMENFTVYHELLKLEVQSIKTGDYKDVDQIKIFKEIKNVLTIIRNLNEFTLVTAILRDSARHNGMLRDHDSFIKVSKLMENSIIRKGISPTSTNREKDSFYKLMSAFVYLKGDFIQMIKHNIIRLQIITNNPHVFEKDYILRLIEVYGVLLYGYVKLDRFEEFDFYFRQLKSLDARTNLEKGTLFSKICLYEFLYLLKKENFQKGVELINNAEIGLKKYEDTIQKDDILIVRYYMCRIYFGAGDYVRALEYSNNLLNHSYIEYRTDVHIYCRILNLIIHYELGNYELLPYIIKSVYRFLYKKGKIYKFETIILAFLKNLKYSVSDSELRRRLIILKSEVLKLHNEPFEKNVFIYFELLSWVDRKISSMRK